MFFLLLRTTDDDSTTQRKVHLLLQRINKLKWRTAANVDQEEKVSVRVRCLPGWIAPQCDLLFLSETAYNIAAFFPKYVGL